MAAIINIVFDILMINKIGLWAPVIGTFMAYFIINTYRNYRLRKYVKLPHDPYEYLRCVFDQSVNCKTKKDFEKLLPWNISISAFHEEGTWKNDA